MGSPKEIPSHTHKLSLDPLPKHTVTMASQKALFLSGVNGTWSVGERPVPKPGPGEVVVKIHSTALNPVDWKASRYSFPFLSNFPAVLGTDSAGTVEAIGEGVTNFKVGDKV